MMQMTMLKLLIGAAIVIQSCNCSTINPFWDGGIEFIEIQQIFEDERFPNVVVAMDGCVVATWGNKNMRVRRSHDGGQNWEPEILVASPGFQGGGTTVDETTGDILFFIEESHPISPLMVYRSKDHGKNWLSENVIIYPDEKGNTPSMHMNERGITLRYGHYPGRLIRPSRFYAGGNNREFWADHYTNAIYSDDHGKTWNTSAPFPATGTGEAALEELEDGSIYYNSRRHMSTDGLNPRKRHIARSFDGGETWENLSVCNDLPDGAQHTDYGLMAGLVRLPLEGYDILLYSNIDVPAETEDETVPFEYRTSRRIRGTVWASFDGGKTWPVKRLVDEGPFAYSSMAAGRNGTASEGLIYLFYESGQGAKIARFNLDWVTGGRDWKEFLP
ncbi:MAG: sialidase family protein [Bacteroidota bacterium]